MPKTKRILIWSVAAAAIAALVYVGFIVAANIGIDTVLH